MLLLKFRQFALASTLVLLASAGLVALQYGTAYAADYPKDWCEFRMAGDESSLTGSCDDAKNNGSFSGKVFSSDPKSEDTYTFTDSYWRYVGPGNFPVTSHDKFTDAPGNVTPEEVKCKPAIIKMSTDGKTASVSGQYASVPPSSPSPLLNGQWQCTDLLEGEVKVTKVSVRMMAWRKAFYDSLLKSIPLLECKRFNKNSDNYNMCAKGMGLVVASCVGPNGSVWTDTKSYASDAEQKKAYKESAAACFDRKLSRTSKSDIKNAVEAAYSNAEKEENKVVDTTGPTTTTDPEDTTSCAIDGIGYLVCPVVTFMGLLNDALYSVIKQFLEIQPSMLNSNSDTYRAWGTMRNIANIAFVIAFLIIIYSQMTGAGISNYGIKKMLPKIIIAAILVNTSFWICAIAVDLSNILGSGLYNLMEGAIGSSSTNTGLGSPVNSWSDVTAWVLSGGAIAGVGIAAAITVGSVGFFGALSLLLPGAIVVLLAFFAVVVMLIARQAFIIILIVIAPLAFVAYLLPNTDQWFQRWRKFLTTLLIMYPSIALLFAGSELAAAVIRAADPENAWLVIGSLVVTALPLFALPALMKAAGGIMSRVAGAVNNPNRGPLDRMKKGADRYRKQQQGIRMGDNVKRTNKIREGSGGALGRSNSWRRRAATRLSGVGNTNAADAAEKDKYSEASANAAKRNYVAGRVTSDDAYVSKIGKGMERDVIAYAQQAQSDEAAKDIKAAATTLSKYDNAQVAKMASTGMDEKGRKLDKNEQAAATYRIMETGSFKERRQALEYVASNKSEFSAEVRNEVVQKSIARGDSNIYGSGFGNQIVNESGTINSGASLAAAAVNNAAQGKVSPEHLVQNGQATEYLIDSSAGNAAARAELKTAAAAARINANTASKVTGEFDKVFKKL